MNQQRRVQPPRRGRVIYFQNFPHDWTAENLWNLFAKRWRIVEVFIPAKAFRRSVRFAFLRIQNIFDCPAVLQFINTVAIGGSKLKGEVSFYSRPFATAKNNSGTSSRHHFHAVSSKIHRRPETAFQKRDHR